MPKKKTLHFKTNVQLKSIIGKDLINDDNIAILELVKNSFDADAKKVIVKYLNLKKNDDEGVTDYSDETSRLIIQDDGTGMTEDEVENKWLNIAYSEKKSVKRKHNRRMAGAKGVGRFSCDRLGKYLNLYTKTKDDEQYLKLSIDWKEFEVEDENKEIQSINLTSETLSKNQIKSCGIDVFDHGVTLEIIKLRSTWVYPIKDEGRIIRWNVEKFVTLKQYLEKLINPNQAFTADDFGIHIKAPEFVRENEQLANNQKFIGQVKNRIFEKLDFKTTSVETYTQESGKEIRTELKDKGKTIFWILENNPFYPEIKNVRITAYYLNTYAKSFFTKQTGIRSVDYGSVFLFINGFRIPPYGEPGNDWLGLDRRKAQGVRRYIGSKEVIGHIEIWDDENQFQIITSREGVVKNDSYHKLIDSDRNNSFFFRAFRRLERYVVDGLNWDSSIYQTPKELSAIEAKIVSGQIKDEELVYREDEKSKQLRVYNTIHSIIGARFNEVKQIYINEDLITEKISEEKEKSEKEFTQLIEDFEKKKIDSETLGRILKSRAKYNEELGKQLRDFEKYTTDEATTKALLELQAYRKTIDEQNELIGKLRNQLKRLEDEKASATKKIEEATNEALKVKKELLKTKTQNLFLQSVKSQDFDEVVSFLHHIGIGAKNIDTELKLFVKKLRKGKEISKNELLQKLDRILLENRKIISISRFASKANFQLFTSIVNIDLIGYITEYIENILGLIPSQDPSITVERGVNDIFELEIKPIEINIIIDNLISNSRRAKATQIIVSFDVKDNQLLVSFEDDGEGIKEEDLDKIFELGYTTTSGSGIGLYHIKNIMESLNGKIFVNKENNDFTEFILEINR